jgi:uncharacterized membrane protein
MTRTQQPALTLFAVGMIGLGILALIYGDFALVWQPVPVWVPGRTALAYASGLVMLLGGVGSLFGTTRVWSTRVLFVYLIIWALLKVPAVVTAPQVEGHWLGLGELTALLAGGWTLFATGEQGVRAARILFAVSLLPIGLSHLVYAQGTADYVPAWLPDRIGWAYLTGAGHIAAGLGVLFSVVPRVAAAMETGMLGVFTLLVWAPAIVATPTARMPWTAFFVSWAITAAAWVVAQNIRPRRDPVAEP